MKILIILVLIIWSVVRAARKAQREQQQRLRRSASANEALRSDGPQVTRRNTLAPVSRMQPTELAGASDNGDNVTELLAPVEEIAADAYSQTNIVTSTGINFDKQSLKTFFVTREILGPPRFRSPFRPGIRK